MGTDGIETKHRTRQICGHPWNPWLKQLRPTENVEEPSLTAYEVDVHQLTKLAAQNPRRKTRFGGIALWWGETPSSQVEARTLGGASPHLLIVSIRHAVH